MKINVKKTRRIALVLGMLMALSSVLSGCINLDEIPELDPVDMMTDISDDAQEATEDEIPTEEGATEAPKNIKVVAVTPKVIAISGRCETDAVIKVTGGKTDVETKANGEYFIIQTELLDQSQTLLKITATAAGKDESKPREYVAAPDATAQKSKDGNNVSIGVDSHLYFDRMAEDASGNDLYSVSELDAIKQYVNETVNAYSQNYAMGQPVEFIYVLVPNATTVNPEVFPEGAVEDTYATAYDQVLSTLNETLAQVVDMREVFAEASENDEAIDKYGSIYRETDTALADYGSYLTYKAIMDIVDDNFAGAAARDIDTDFTWSTVTDVQGGNLVDYRGLDDTLITEDIRVAKPGFSLDLGTDTTISSLRNKKYVSTKDKDYDIYKGDDGLSGNYLIDTGRVSAEDEVRELPNALIYRDEASFTFADILLERFNKALMVTSGNFNVNLGNAASSLYKAEGTKAVDYIIVIVSEENMGADGSAFKAAFAA